MCLWLPLPLPQYTATASAPCSTPAGGGSEEDEEEAEEEGEEEGEEEEVDEEAAGRDPEAAAAARAEVQRLLVEQVCGRVRWRESAVAMKEAGVESFVELGGKVVAPMISRSAGEVATTSVVTMADIEMLLKEIA